jgi:hypothetical protein
MATPRIIKRHDTAVQPRSQFKDENNAVIDLTGATVRYTLRNTDTLALKINRAAAVIESPATGGIAHYQFVAGDVDTSGTYEEEWEVTYPSTAKESFPVDAPQFVIIKDDVDNV